MSSVPLPPEFERCPVCLKRATPHAFLSHLEGKSSAVDRSATLRAIFLIFWLILPISLGSCAALPKASDFIHRHVKAGHPPKVIGANGPLSPKESKARIEQVKSQTHSPDLLQHQITAMEVITSTPLVAGNKITLLVDTKATFEAMLKAIEKATQNINLETFTFEDDAIGRRFAELLLRKAAEGVRVNLIYDCVGSWDTPDSFFDRLRQGGIHVFEFNPVNRLEFSWFRRLTERDHRKILTIDGSVAFTGGVNITLAYSGVLSGEEKDKKSPKRWRDTAIQIEGPAVAEFQKLFLNTWARQEGSEPAENSYFPPLKEVGNDLVRVVGSTRGAMNRVPYLMYVSAISHSQKSVHLTSSYFAPNEETVKALVDAARRGVDVRLVLPSFSDHRMLLHAGRYHYTRLLKAGVRIHEHSNVILHAKTAVIDSVWSIVGSTNMDLWSFLRNDEVNAVVLGRDFADQMEALFREDEEESHEIKLSDWKKRPAYQRIKEWFYHKFTHWL